MKVKNILIAGLLGSALFSCDKKEESTETPLVLTSLKDSASYAMGFSMATETYNNMTRQGAFEYIEKAKFIEGFNAAFDSTSLQGLTQEEMNVVYTNYAQQIEGQERAKQLEEKAKAAQEFASVKEEGEKFLAENKSKTGVITTESGLQYEVLVKGKGEKPTAQSAVKVHYTGTLLDGTQFDSSVERGEPAVLTLNQVIKGWTEGIQLMSVGAKYKFYIPQELAYGDSPRPGGPIKPFAALVFEVELLEIVKK